MKYWSAVYGGEEFL